ncbi:TadE/TadG family type IV pilus assembly protein [Novosphingobium sp. TH158]|uniref:TadE/TadG family type IV pilus assembly protein n=1 Tax=Novosphingobium sp. TH158 TaxID=2067455 RepID=UPI000C7DCEF5|nr:TadE/TadG family type IV pilus assembly protein [Novosphingobium sp. TH158]PLK26316.1 hypothetical protein C0V78_05055 [Novosphingobium sp. TH158]
MKTLSALQRLMRRLTASRRGNVLAIVALGLPALLVLIGGGIDMSRAYMARTSLQNACDAGVLAGRRAMSKSGTWSTAEQAKAQTMFAFNFQSSTVQASNTSFTMAANAAGEVTGSASTRVPTTLMRMFGWNEYSLNLTCGAELQLASADVMFVIDTTGSMACEPSGSNCTSGSTSKLQGLRDAVRDFYKVVAAAVIDKNTTRIRFGFVPYAMTVNTKDLVSAGDIPTSYFADSHTYQTKLAYFGTPSYAGTDSAPEESIETYPYAITSGDCDYYANNDYPSWGNNPVTSGTAPSTTMTTTYSYSSWTRTSGSSWWATGTCKRKKSVVTTTWSVSGYRFSNYVYRQASVPTASYKGLGPVSYVTSISSSATVPTQGTYDMVTLAAMAGTSGLSRSSDTWDGCIEERATVQDLSMNPVPAGATDLDITSAPSSESSRWKPYWSAMEIWRGNSSATLTTTANYSGMTEYCPSPMKKFTEVDTSSPGTVPSWLDTYLNNLVAWGGTYHDIGMIWGGRLANPDGILASNVNEGNREPSRHIIFLTDGIMEPARTAYSAYGVEAYDARVAPMGTAPADLTTYHNARFLAACNATKAKGYTIWVIGFGVSLTDEMRACSSGGRAYASNDTTTLKNTFKFIAGEVADLRINQ